jgi:hypothetical protein
MQEFFENNGIPQKNIDLYKTGNYMMYETKPVVNYLKSKGYDSMRLRESTDDNYPTIAVFDPKHVRSRFAAFDPEREHENDLLASKGGEVMPTDKNKYVSVLDQGNMASPEYRAYLERNQALEESHPEIDLAGLGIKSLLQRGGNFIKGLMPSSEMAITQAQREANLANFLNVSKAPSTLYHGTDKSFSAFDQSKLKRIGWGEGFHLAEDPSLASQYASIGTGANVMPVHASIKNPLVLNSPHDWWDLIPGESNQAKTAWAKSQGYDGIKYPHSQPKKK